MLTLDFFLNPNLIYLALMVGFSLTLMAIFTPGTGFIELIALSLFIYAGYGAYTSQQPLNLWAIVLLGLGVFPFLLALRRSRRNIFLVLSIAALVVGSAYLFQGEGWQPGVNPLLALVVSVVTAGYFWLAVTKTLEAEKQRPSHTLETLVGSLGEAKTDILTSGSAQVAGELWSVYSDQPISNGSMVRVLGREGFILKVENANVS